ncbi:hypothetical protein DSO57_1034117 [Entomophthora muscae]|uniref:Uncharacterized protein n=1 Tax=Entomophthora muscae TaxID=34485 RepID=A0ACC2S1U7_9FUNG|nr:hypothetical protein DSO57_1034117 [Entomophthora muscae]
MIFPTLNLILCPFLTSMIFSLSSIKTSEPATEALTSNSVETSNLLNSSQTSTTLDPSITNKVQTQKGASKAGSIVSPVKVDTTESKLEIILEEPSAKYPANKLKRTFAQPLRTSPSKRPQKPLILAKAKRTSTRVTQKLIQPKSIAGASIQSPAESNTTEFIPTSQDTLENAESRIIASSQSDSGNPISKEELKEAVSPIPPTEGNGNVAGSLVPPQETPDADMKPPLIPKRDDNNAISSRTRRASRGDTTLVTQPIKKLRSSKKTKDDTNPKPAASNLKIGCQVSDMNLSKRNLSANPKAMLQLSPSSYRKELSTPNSNEMPTEVDLHQQGETNVSQDSPLSSVPIATQNLDSSLISSPIIVSDPSDTNIDDAKRQISCSPQDSSVDSDVEHCLFEKSDAQNIPKSRSSSQPLIHSAFQEFSSGSITPIKSYPNSAQMPWLDTAQYKTWKKLAQMVLKDIAHHRLAPLFQRPIKESLAPGYYSIVKRPMDLSTIQSRIKNGVITTTEEFTRDVLLMCQNALMFNRVDTEIHQMAQEMLASVKGHLETLNAAVLYNSASQQHVSTPVFPPPKQ